MANSLKIVDVSTSQDFLGAYFGSQGQTTDHAPSDAPPHPPRTNNDAPSDTPPHPPQTNNGGRLRSLPCNKYGPYKCPECLEEFNSSQKFASHTKVHCWQEGQEEKRRRIAARINHGNFGRSSLSITKHMTEGLTIVPSTDLQLWNPSSSSAQKEHDPILPMRVPSPPQRDSMPLHPIGPPIVSEACPFSPPRFEACPHPPGFEAYAHAHPFTTHQVKSEPDA